MNVYDRAFRPFLSEGVNLVALVDWRFIKLHNISVRYAIRSVFFFCVLSAFCVLRIFDPHYVLRIAYCV